MRAQARVISESRAAISGESVGGQTGAISAYEGVRRVPLRS